VKKIKPNTLIKGEIIVAIIMVLQPSQPLLRILNLSYTRVSVFLEFEEFFEMFYGFGFSSTIIS